MKVIGTLLFLLPILDNNADELIKDLGANKFKTREAATEKLKKMGFEVLPLIKKAVKSGDPEIARRAYYILHHYYNNFPVIYQEMPYIGKIDDKSPYIELAFKKLASSSLQFNEVHRASWIAACKWMNQPNQPRRIFLTIHDYYHNIAFKKCRKYGLYTKDKDRFICFRIATELFAKDLLKWGVPKNKVIEIIKEASKKMK